MRVPLGLVGQSIGVASFPILAQLYSERKFDEMNRILNSTFKALIILLVPISALTIAESLPLVHFVFSHTRLQASDLKATSLTLACFSIGMFAWGAQNILARGFYAARDTITPAVVGTVTTLLSLPLYWLLVRKEQHLGLALASSTGIIAYTIVLFVLLNRRTKNHEQAGLVVLFGKVAAASAVAAYACYAFTRWIEGAIAWQGTLGALLVLVLATLVGILALGALMKLFRVAEFDHYLRQAAKFVFSKHERVAENAAGLE